MKTRQPSVKSKWYPFLTGVLSLTVLGINLLMIKPKITAKVELHFRL